jgi:hypothetical protein
MARHGTARVTGHVIQDAAAGADIDPSIHKCPSHVSPGKIIGVRLSAEPGSTAWGPTPPSTAKAIKEWHGEGGGVASMMGITMG